MNASTLAGRDPALAAMMGALNQGKQDADFGQDFQFAMEDFDFEGDAGDDLHGDDYDLFGQEFQFAQDAPAPRLTKGQVMKAAQQAIRDAKATRRRRNLLQPNAGSKIDVEKYSFPISNAITLGTAGALNFGGQPDTHIRPKRVTMNAPTPMFVEVNDLKVANVSVLVGPGVEDAFNYSAQGVSQALDMPLLSPANRATFTGNYTGFTPPGYVATTVVNFTVSFKGPATIVA